MVLYWGYRTGWRLRSNMGRTLMKDQLQKRLHYLWTFELLNALFVFPFCYYAIGARFRLGWYSLASLALVCAILLVGAAFWFQKSRALAASKLFARPEARRCFRTSKLVFGAALTAMIGLLIVRAFFQDNASPAELAAGSALSVLALLEYVNYYFVQLMYDNRADLRYLLRNRRLKRAVMARDLGI